MYMGQASNPTDVPLDSAGNPVYQATAYGVPEPWYTGYFWWLILPIVLLLRD